MAAALVARGAPVRSRSTEILSVGSLSIVVDSADNDPPPPPGVGDEATLEIKEKAPSEGSSPSPDGKSYTEIKLALYKTEAAERLTKLERLLDEHDQIIRELKRSESAGSGINYAGLGGPNHPLDFKDRPPPIGASRTAPASPSASSGPKLGQ